MLEIVIAICNKKKNIGDFGNKKHYFVNGGASDNNYSHVFKESES